MEGEAPPSTSNKARKLRKVDATLARDASFLAQITGVPCKVTLPAASWFAAPPTFRPGGDYDSHEELLADTVAIQRELIGEAVAAGARYIQLDFPRQDRRSRPDLLEAGGAREGRRPTRPDRAGCAPRPARAARDHPAVRLRVGRRRQ